MKGSKRSFKLRTRLALLVTFTAVLLCTLLSLAVYLLFAPGYKFEGVADSLYDNGLITAKDTGNIDWPDHKHYLFGQDRVNSSASDIAASIDVYRSWLHRMWADQTYVRAWRRRRPDRAYTMLVKRNVRVLIMGRLPEAEEAKWRKALDEIDLN